MKQQQKYKEKLMITGQIHNSCQSTAVNPWLICRMIAALSVVSVQHLFARAPSNAQVTPEGTATPQGGQCQGCSMLGDV